MTTVTPSMNEQEQLNAGKIPHPFAGRSLLGMFLIFLGIGIVAAVAGQIAIDQLQATPIRWNLYALEAAGGGVLAMTGFSLVANAMRDDKDVALWSENQPADHADRHCRSCQTINRPAAKFCDQCGCHLG